MSKEQKKSIWGVFAIILCLCVTAVVIVVILNNQNGEPEHTHKYSSEYERDETNHWLECECGEKSEFSSHTFVDGVCSCGYEEIHVHDFDETKYDTDNHWLECECGEKEQVEEHALVNGECECGYENRVVIPNGPTHTHSYECKYNGTYHWEECNCGNKTELVAHNGGKATCTNKAICGSCGQQYGEFGAHSYGNWVSNRNGTHTKTCENENSHKTIENCTDNGNGVCAFCGETLKTKQEIYIREGNKIYFGYYPQTEVVDSSLKTTLNNLAGTLPNSTNNNNWTSYEYYIEGQVKNFMWYIDVTTGGVKYRGVYFTSYRPHIPNIIQSNARETYQDDNGYYINTVYWFKYEPIEWRILFESGGKALLMSNLILDSQAYQNEWYLSKDYYYTNSNGAPSGTYANNYKYSTIRSWLNNNFYNIAFGDKERPLINTVMVDNSAQSTGKSNNQYACENTNDKVFLLSYQEIINSEYGFSGNFEDDTRELKTTDYAQSQGCFTYPETIYLGQGCWWLRSPDDFDDLTAGAIEARYVGSGNTYSIENGVVPALEIQLD